MNASRMPQDDLAPVDVPPRRADAAAAHSSTQQGIPEET